METFDFEVTDRTRNYFTGIVRDNWVIIMFKMSNIGSYYIEYPPAPEFYRIMKNFYPNGRLKSQGKIIGENLHIGEMAVL